MTDDIDEIERLKAELDEHRFEITQERILRELWKARAEAAEQRIKEIQNKLAEGFLGNV